MLALNPYLQFNGEAEDALNFYKSIFGGEADITRFSDFPGMPVADDQKNQLMHAVLKTKELQLMLSDATPTGGVAHGENISLSLSGDDEATLTQYFKGLCEGGTVTDELSAKQWGDVFGMVTDKFGINWMVNITKPKS
jgi:PhnB protein